MQHAAGKRVAKADGAEEGPRIDAARFVGRVAKAFHTAQERGGTLQIRLSPPELGAMRLELTVKDGVMSAALETENASARRALLDHLPALRERLAEQNIRVERFDVDVRRDGGGQQEAAAQNQQHGGEHRHGEPRRQPNATSRHDEPVRQQPTIMLPTIDGNGINLVA
jgi:flagellar hook-length control protein FliK